MTASRLRPVLVAAGILAYALLQHSINVKPQLAILGAPLAVAPLVWACLTMTQRSRHPLTWTTLAVLSAAGLLWHFWPHLERNFSLLFMLQEVGIYLTLAVVFGRSLAAGHTPLCTQWARMLHGELNQAVESYTRQVTVAWTVFFIGIGLTSATLYMLAPLRVWSFFSNFMTLPLAAIMFAIEYELRRHRLPWMRRARFVDMARAYAATMRDGAARS